MKTLYINIYKDCEDGTYSAVVYSHDQAATKNHNDPGFVKTIEVQIEK